MADGHESDRTEAWFSGRLKLSPRPRRIHPKAPEKDRPDKDKPCAE